MATFQKRGNAWRAIVRKGGITRSKTFYKKSAARLWAETIEHEIVDGKYYRAPDRTFGELLERYRKQVTIRKKTAARESNRIDAMLRDPIARVQLVDLDASAVTEWRDRRLDDVSPATVIRDWNLLSHACNLAVIEWGWLQVNPFKTAKKPPKPDPRARVFSQDEIDKILHACGYPGTTQLSRVGDTLLFALETAMRQGEICALTWANVHPRHVHIPTSKNGKARNVPLSAKARDLIARQSKADPVFDMPSPDLLSVLFRRCRDRAGIDDLHFHDARRTALTRLAKTYDVLNLAKISGHLDLRMLLQVYYSPSIDDLADQLDPGE